MVTTYKTTKDKLLSFLKDKDNNIGIEPENIIEVSSDHIDFNIQAPFLYCNFEYGEAKTVQGHVCTLEISLFVGVEAENSALAKEQADTISSKLLSLILNNDLAYIPQNKIFKSFFSTYSNKCIILINLENTIISHE